MSAEVAPFVSDAVERYLEAYVEVAPRLGAEWIEWRIRADS